MLATFIHGTTAGCALVFHVGLEPDSSGSAIVTAGEQNTITINYLRVKAFSSECLDLHFEAIFSSIFSPVPTFQTKSDGTDDIEKAILLVTPPTGYTGPTGMIVKLVDSAGVVYRSTDLVIYASPSSIA